MGSRIATSTSIGAGAVCCIGVCLFYHIHLFLMPSLWWTCRLFIIFVPHHYHFLLAIVLISVLVSMAGFFYIYIVIIGAMVHWCCRDTIMANYIYYLGILGWIVCLKISAMVSTMILAMVRCKWIMMVSDGAINVSVPVEPKLYKSAIAVQ